MSLKQKTISALSWSACERFSQQSIQFIITIILARLLVPAEFGLIGMLTIFMAIAQSFVNRTGTVSSRGQTPRAVISYG